MKLRNHLTSIAIYLCVVLATVICSTRLTRVQGEQPGAQPAAGSPQPSPTVKPRFSLSTNRTYGTQEKARLYINYQGLDSLDFRIYQIKDPFQFFKQLNNPHQMGKGDQAGVAEVAATVDRRPSVLERLRSFKRSVFYGVKNYFRSQLRRETRTVFNDRYRSGDQIPINVAEYAGLPLLNSNQHLRSFRQVLTPLDNEYDTRMVALDKLGAGVYLVEATHGDLRAYTIAVVTDTTMITKTTEDGNLLVYAVDRKSGEPRNGVKVMVVREGRVLGEGSTDEQGVLRTRIRSDASPKPTPKPPVEDQDPEEEEAAAGENRDDYLILASNRDQFAISDLSSYFFGWNRSDQGGPSLNGAASYIYTDRPIYRPDQTVFFKGILRRQGENDYELLGARAVNVIINDPNGKEVFRRELPLSPRGTFNGELPVAATAPLGSYSLIVKVNEAEAARGYFEVAEYKKPQYKVTVATPKPFVPVGEKTTFTVEAKYFFGEPVRNADVKYYIYRSRYYHSWWRDESGDGLGESDEEEDGDGEHYGYGNDMVQEGQGRLGADGRLEIAFEVPKTEAKDPWDYTYRLEAQVTDAARRTIEGKAGFVGTRGQIVAYARPDRYVYYQHDAARIRILTSDYEGRPVSAKVTLKFVEVKYEKIEKDNQGYTYFEYKPIRKDLSAAEVQTNAQGETSYEYKVPLVGFIDIEMYVDEGGRKILSNGGFLYSVDRNNQWGDWSYRDYGSIKLVADKKSYQPGETAHVMAMLPTEKAHLLVTTELSKVMEVRHVYAEGRAVLLDVPIKDNYAPNVYLSVAYVKDGEMYEHGKSLSVPARGKFLQVEVLPDKKQYKPREPASYTIATRNADGSPAAGVEVSLGVVDEAIYSIRPDGSGDIRRAFYGTRYSQVSTNFSSSYSFTGYSGKKEMQLARNKRSYQLADFKNENQYAETTIRKEFKDTAFWQPGVVTGADGKATVKFNLPDNLTTWRATVRAVSEDLKVGSKVDRVLSRKDLILRLEAPKFMTEGDVAVVSGIVHNYLDADQVGRVKLTVEGANLIGEAQQTVTVARQGEQRIDWRISASQVGKVTLTATAETKVESDGIEIPLTVEPIGLKQTKGGAAVLAAETAEKVFSFEAPANANAQTRTLRIEAAPSMVGALFGALDYLTSYPYGCTEQTMSGFLPNVIVAQTLKEVKSASIRANNDLPKKVQRGLEQLYDYQHDDGGWGWWKNDKTDPFMTAYVVDGLTLARRAGFGIDNYRFNRGRDRIRQLLDTGKLSDGKPVDLESYAYLVYAYYESGEGADPVDPRYVNELFAKRNELQPYGRALLALTLKLRNDQGRMREVAGEIERSARVNDFDAHWESRRRPMLDLYEEDDIEATALSIKALAQILPESELLPKAARWVVGNRSRGYYWDATKQTAFAIFGLIEYIKVSKELAPADYTVEVYLNGEQVLSKRVTGAEAASGQNLSVERAGAALPGTNQVRVVKRGKGVLYASATLDYFTKEDNVAAQSTPNLNLTREYLRLVVSEVKGKPTWTIKPLEGELRSGDLIVAKLRLQGARGRYLMVEDPIPAGCEQVERVSGINLDYSEGHWSDWYNKREFRDQRTV
ncbi:MAG TPA: MG2 domain-containing protein, partial [Blastocatellia bacterium]|nr:MG2 domain-containing protein [Blastocatellia bacterium]